VICTSAIWGTWFRHRESSDFIPSSSTVKLIGLELGQLPNKAQWHQSLPVTSVLSPFSSGNILLLEQEILQIVALEILTSNFLHSSVQPKPKFHRSRLRAWNGHGTWLISTIYYFRQDWKKRSKLSLGSWKSTSSCIELVAAILTYFWSIGRYSLDR